MDEFLKSVKEMSKDDILLALEEQADLYNEEELKILKKELNVREIESTKNKKEEKIGYKKEKTDDEYDAVFDLLEQTKNGKTIDNTVYNGNFWTKFLKAITIISLMILLIAGLFIGSEIGGTEGFFTGVGIVIITMVSVATIMIFIEIYENVYKMKKNSDEVLKIMRNKK